jgi:Uma2 family endonuclease
MAGGSPAHSALCTDVSCLLGNAIEAAGGSCDSYNSQVKVRSEANGPFFYPDATVVRGEPDFDEDDCLRNPTLIVEVTSPSSLNYDTGEKSRYYRRFETLEHYLLVSQEERRVVYYRRVEGVVWNPVGEYTEAGDVIPIPELGISLPLSAIYRRAAFA